MKPAPFIYRNYDHLPEAAQGAVVAIGNFDGLHRGHQAVLAQAAEIAHSKKLALGVLTFNPHPRMFFVRDHAPHNLMSFREKVHGFQRLDVDCLYVLRFNEMFSKLSAEDFVHNVLLNGLRVKHIVTGEDFVYGYKRGGNAESLKRDAQAHGVGLTLLPAIKQSSERCSSSAIRAALAEGNVTKAEAILGHAYALTGRVREGDKRGREIGFPTANILLSRRYLPRFGVYAVEAFEENAVDGKLWHGVANLGRRPTIGGDAVLLEAHLFDVSPILYGKRLTVRLKHFLRAEQKFDSIHALKEQIAADAIEARKWFAERGLRYAG